MARSVKKAKRATSAKRATKKATSAKRATKKATSAKRATKKATSAKRATKKATSAKTKKATSAKTKKASSVKRTKKAKAKLSDDDLAFLATLTSGTEKQANEANEANETNQIKKVIDSVISNLNQSRGQDNQISWTYEFTPQVDMTNNATNVNVNEDDAELLIVDKAHIEPYEIKIPRRPNVIRTRELTNTDKKYRNDTLDLKHTVEMLIEKIGQDDFIRDLLQSEITLLKYKYNLYKEFSKISFSTKHSESSNDKLDEILKNQIDSIKKRYKQIKLITDENIIQKRKDMIEFVTDKSNGLESIKGKSRHNIRLLIIKMIFTFAKAPILYGNTFLNIMLTGPAGSGKTKIASVFAHAFYKMGFLMRDYVKFATSQNMIGEYIGQSAPKTRTTLQDAIEGVLFIDEAYTLTPCQDVSKNISFQTESMGELINFLDKFKGCLVVIVAGYKDKMYNCFLEFNEGLNRRFPQKIDLIDYSSEDLFLLLKNFLSNIVDPDKAFSKSQQDFILQLLSQLNEHNVFTNQAGDMLNLSTLIIEDAITYMGHYDDVKIIDTFKSFLSSKQLTMDIDM